MHSAQGLLVPGQYQAGQACLKALHLLELGVKKLGHISVRPPCARVPTEIPQVSQHESPSHQYSSTSATGAAHFAATPALPGQQQMPFTVRSPDSEHIVSARVPGFATAGLRPHLRMDPHRHSPSWGKGPGKKNNPPNPFQLHGLPSGPDLSGRLALVL